MDNIISILAILLLIRNRDHFGSNKYLNRASARAYVVERLGVTMQPGRLDCILKFRSLIKSQERFL